MLWVFSSVGLIGVSCAGLFRGPAMIVFSMMAFGGIFVVSTLVEHTLGDAFITAFVTSAALQLGFLLGLCVQEFCRQVLARFTGLSRELQYEKLLNTLFHKPSLRTADRRSKMRDLAR